MKKIRNSRRGFTLTEILLVTGIIVLVSAAAFVAVAVTLNRARDASDDARNHADNFELEARSWIETITPNKADFASQSYYEPESESSESETESETSESTTESTVDGFVATNTPKPTPTNTPTPTPTKAPTNTPKPSGGAHGVPAGGTTVPTSSYSYSTNHYSWGNTVTANSFDFSDSKFDGTDVYISVTYSGNVTNNQASNCQFVTTDGKVATYVIKNYSHYTTNYSFVVNENVSVESVTFTSVKP